MQYILVGIIALATTIGGFFGLQQSSERFGAFGDPFLSRQVATTSLGASKILQTDGFNSSWITCATLTGSAELCDGGDATGGGGGSFPFSADTNYGQVVYSTSTPTLWLKSGLFASSTSYFTSARFTNATTTSLHFTGLTLGSLGIDGNGQVYDAATTTYSGGLTYLNGNVTNTITAGDALTRTVDDIDFDGGATPAGDLGNTWADPTVDDDSHAHTGTTLSAIDLSDDVNLTAGDALTLTGDDIDFDGGTAPGGSLGGSWASPTIDDLFLLNTGDFGTGHYNLGTLFATNASSTNATTTSLNVTSTYIDFDNLTSALLLTGATGILAEYAGAGCTNQVVEDISALGASTCVSIESEQLGDDDWGQVSITSGVATVEDITCTDCLNATEIEDLYILDDGDVGTGVFDFGGATSFEIPNSTNPTVSAAGEVAVNTTAASSSIRFHDGTAERSLYPDQDYSVTFASSTLAYLGSYSATATTTIQMGAGYRPETITQMYCYTDTGTATVQIGDGVATSTNTVTYVRCTSTGGSFSPTSNNSFTYREKKVMGIGSAIGAPNQITITTTIRKDAD